MVLVFFFFVSGRLQRYPLDITLSCRGILTLCGIYACSSKVYLLVWCKTDDNSTWQDITLPEPKAIRMIQKTSWWGKTRKDNFESCRWSISILRFFPLELSFHMVYIGKELSPNFSSCMTQTEKVLKAIWSIDFSDISICGISDGEWVSCFQFSNVS